MGLDLQPYNTVYFDTSPFIYFLEDNEEYADKINKVFTEIIEKDIQIVTSIISYIEIITRPEKAKADLILAKYREFFTNSENLSIYPVNTTIAEETARLRAAYNFKTPDAIHLATAIKCGADYIITNDKKWEKIGKNKIILVKNL